MLYVIDVLDPADDTVGFAYGSLYVSGREQAVIGVDQVVPIQDFKKDAFGRFHIIEDPTEAWDRALLHRPRRVPLED